MHKCGAETDAGKCSRLIGNKFKFCHEHRPSRTTTYGGEELDPVHQETRKEIIKMLWDDSKELMKMYPQITLSEIFYYIQDSALDEGFVMSREYVIKWYRKTQKRKGHPIELTYKENAIAYRSKPYKDILEHGLPRPKKDIVIEYARQNPEDNYKQISIITGVNYQSVQNILKKAGLARSRWSIDNKPKEKAVLKFIEEKPDADRREIRKNIDVSDSHLSRIIKKHKLKIATDKNKGSRAITYIENNPSCSMNEVMENIGISYARLKVVLDKENIKLKSDEKLVLDYLSGKKEINLEETIEKLKITPHSLYKIVVKHDLEIL